jgi:hypothetical protein
MHYKRRAEEGKTEKRSFFKNTTYNLLMRSMLVFLLVVSAVGAYTFDAALYDAQTVTAGITVNSSITLQGTGSGESLQAIMHYVPEESEDISATPQPASVQPLVFSWQNVHAGTYPFGYETTVTTSAQRPKITQKIAYPFSSPTSVTQYLQPQEITNTNREIRAKAHELATGKTDSVEVVFAISQWVHQYVSYNLTTATAQASEPSTWVYANQYGVCDEITSLFISLSREAGIPARFVSGIAYTNLEQFDDNWGPHGWAEVWLPDVGWVPVDVTYGETLYVDATHIPIRHSTDARNTAIDYSLRARNLQMEAGELNTRTTVLSSRGDTSEPLSIQITPLYAQTAGTSGNAITAAVTNNADYYVATELYLATTPQTRLHEKRTQQVLLPPHSTRQVQWRISMPSYERNYQYTVPFTVIANRAGNASTSVLGSTTYKTYPVPPATAVVSSIPIECEEPPVLYPGESATVQCNTPVGTLCADTCGTETLTVAYTATIPGAFPQVVRATNNGESGSTVVTFIVENKPMPAIGATLPKLAHIDDTLSLTVQVDTAPITHAAVTVSSEYLSQVWNATTLDSQAFELRFPATYLQAGENTVTITVTGLDKNGSPVQSSATILVTLQASALERVRLFFVHLFL